MISVIQQAKWHTTFLVNGADISTMDVQYAENVTKEYNADICSQLGITVPDDYTAIAAE